MSRASAGAGCLGLSLLVSLAALSPGVGARPAAQRAPDAPDAEQRRALSGLGENDPDPTSDGSDGAATARDPAAELAPDRYVVRKGDTLWGICDVYFHDPWRWPKVWALNPEVTNPHWIFPGQTIRIGGITQTVATLSGDAPAPVAPADKNAPGRTTMTTASRALGNGLLREIGFVETRELAFAGTIDGSPEEKILLASGDQVYVQFSVDKQPKVGQRFTIYRVDEDHPMRDPGSSAVLGYVVRIFGDLTIESMDKRFAAVATLRDLTESVERGYRVGPVFRQFRTIKPRPNAVGTQARVVGAIVPTMLIFEGMFVVLDRGHRDGVEVGNRLRVVRQRDGYQRLMEDADVLDPRFPPDPVADLLTVDVRDQTSIAWVTGGTRTVRLGDLADMKKGY